ncbi:MAG: chromate efflux transporter [Deferribacteres bacterium]|nr:chromate efflux transporter [Deferribacteres bacterium]
MKLSRAIEVAKLFFKLGVIAFGGPAAHIAMMQREVVQERKWMSEQHFLDLVGATNLIPGPNSTEMAIHCGYHHAGLKGLLLAGLTFILPATVITGGFAWGYATYHTVPQLAAFVFGMKPAVISIILMAVFQMSKKALKGWQLGVIGFAVIVMSLSGINEIAAILIGGVAGMLWLKLGEKSPGTKALVLPFLFKKSALLVPTGAVVVSAASLSHLFWVFLKIGAVLFGSGYVLVAYLDGELVNHLGWLTEGELLDAIAIGQFTPGPVLSTATFIGYQIQGVWGAILATVGIFLPSFFFVAALNPLIPKLRQSKWASAFLDAVNVSALGLMVAVTIKLGMAVLFDWKALVIAVLSVFVSFRYKKVSSAWVIIGGAVLGFLLTTSGQFF